jgi:mRNA-degrading endonuclease RelE of RelBE toxin-antitoxin system
MEIVETSVYTEDIIKLLSDEEYQELQRFLVEHPTFGDLIQGSKGLRKLRWKLKNKGKSGGIRNIYYYYEEKKTLYMIYVYEKSKTEDLTPKQIEILRKTFLGD